MDEYLDIVDDEDQVLGKALRNQIYANFHPHRIVHILVFNDKGEILLQMRSGKNKYLPLIWGTSSGGHVLSGESYEEAAKRELKEELGLAREMEFLEKMVFIHPDSKIKKHISVFKTHSNGPFQIDPEEGERLEFKSLREIKKMKKNGEKFMPELSLCLKKIFDIFP